MKGMGDFFKYIEDVYNLCIKVLRFGCLEIGLKCVNVEGFICLWMDYELGYFNKIVERCFLIDEVIENFQMKDVRVKMVIKDGKYFVCKKLFQKLSKVKVNNNNK